MVFSNIVEEAIDQKRVIQWLHNVRISEIYASAKNGKELSPDQIEEIERRKKKILELDDDIEFLKSADPTDPEVIEYCEKLFPPLL